MPRREVSALLRDIEESCRGIADAVRDRDFADYEQTRGIRLWVEREFTIIGEALGKALRLAPEMEGSITGARKIVDFRNQLVHGSSVIDDDAVWSFIHEKLPVLLAEVEGLLSS